MADWTDGSAGRGRALLLGLALVAWGCTGPEAAPDGGGDAGTEADAGRPLDAGHRADGGPTPDAGSPVDPGPSDGGAPDAGVPGLPSGCPHDAGAADWGSAPELTSLDASALRVPMYGDGRITLTLGYRDPDADLRWLVVTQDGVEEARYEPLLFPGDAGAAQSTVWLETRAVHTFQLEVALVDSACHWTATRSASVEVYQPPFPPPPPTLTGLSPQWVVPGSGALVLSVTGRFFTPTTQVLLDGVLLPGAVSASSTVLEVPVDAALVAQPRQSRVTAVDPQGSGLLSNELVFQVAENGAFLLPLQLRDLVRDDTRGVLYASSWDGDGAGVLSILDLATLRVLRAMQVPGNPGPLALSDDGSRLYVGQDWTGWVDRYRLPGFERDLTFWPGSAQGTGLALAVRPGAPRTVVVHVGSGIGRTAIFDDGVERPAVLAWSWPAGPTISEVAWSRDGGQLYGVTSTGLALVEVSDAGLAVGSLLRDDLGVPRGLQVDPRNGTLYLVRASLDGGSDPVGLALDPAGRTLATLPWGMGFLASPHRSDLVVGSLGYYDEWLELLPLGSFAPSRRLAFSVTSGMPTASVRMVDLGDAGIVTLDGWTSPVVFQGPKVVEPP